MSSVPHFNASAQRPFALVMEARKAFSAQRKSEGLCLLDQAIHRRVEDMKPALLLAHAINICIDYRMRGRAIEYLKLGMSEHPDDLIFPTQLAKIYLALHDPIPALQILEPIHQAGRSDLLVKKTLGIAYDLSGQSPRAISLLKPIHRANPQDTYTANALAEAYTNNGEPQQAIDLLTPIYKAGNAPARTIKVLAEAHMEMQDFPAAIGMLEPLFNNAAPDKRILKALATAYILTTNRSGFDRVKRHILPEPNRDYLDAKLSYFEGKPDNAVETLKPYWVKGVEGVTNRMLALIMACFENDHPVIEYIEKTVGPNTYEYLLARREEWRSNLLRMDAEEFDLPNDAPETPGTRHHRISRGPAARPA